MTPKFWLHIKLEDGEYLVLEFDTKEELNDYLVTCDEPEKIVSLEVVSGFSITKRTRGE